VPACAVLVLVIMSAFLFWRHPGAEGGGSPVSHNIGYQMPALNAIQMLSATDGWAVGSRTDSQHNSSASLLHLVHGQWQESKQQFPGLSLSGIAMLSPNAGWAVGGHTSPPSTMTASHPRQTLLNESAVILQYHNGTWRQFATFPHSDLYEIQMLNANEGWAIGDNYTISNIPTRQPNEPSNVVVGNSFVLYYQAGTWTKVAVPVAGTLQGIAMLNPDEGWAIAQTSSLQEPQPVILHYQNGIWTRWGQQFPATFQFNALSMASSHDGWIAGADTSNRNDILNPGTVLLHFDGTAWTRVAAPATVTRASIAALVTSGSTSWAVGEQNSGNEHGDLSHNSHHIFALHYTAGQWVYQTISTATSSDTYADLFGMTIAPKGDVWAVGVQTNISGNYENDQPLILHEHQGQWNTTLPPGASK